MKRQKVEFYCHPVGGWGALKNVTHQSLSQGIAAKGAKTMLSANQSDGFDCPGCAWPDHDHASTFEFCENGVKAMAAEAVPCRTTPEFFAQHTVRELAEWSDYALGDQGRLTCPMIYDAGSDKYVPIDWDATFALIAQRLRALPDPNQAIFYASGRTSDGATFLYQLFVHAYGTNNFPDCSNMCHEPSGTDIRVSIGVGKGTVTFDDFTKTDIIFIFGQNPGTDHPRTLGELREASKCGASIVSFSPPREHGLEHFADPQSKIEMLTLGSTCISTEYHQVRIGGDLATVKGIIKHVIERDDAARSRGEPTIIDHAFIAQHTGDYDTFAANVRTESWATIEAESGLPEHEIRQAGDTYVKAGSVIACWGMGITQHKHSVTTIQMTVNLLLLRGNTGRSGASACPVRGHNNVQGDRMMGVYEKPAPAFLDRLERVFSIQVSREHGHDTVGAIETMQRGTARVFFAVGGNFAAAAPDTAATWAGLCQCGLTVHMITKLNRSHIVHGKTTLILPCLGRTGVDQQAGGAQGVTVEDSMSMVHMSAGINSPVSPHLFPEPAIVAHLAEATLPESTIPWYWLIEDYGRIRERIEAVSDGFAGFNERIHVPGGFRLRNTASERAWNTSLGKTKFHAHAVPADTPIHRAREHHVDTTVFTLATVRSHDQYNTTIYGMDDRYRGVFGQCRVIFINKEDLHTVRTKDGEWVDMVTLSEDGTTRRVDGFRLVAYNIPRGCLTVYYPETNPLVPLSSVADQACTSTPKSIPVMLVPSQVARTADTQVATTAEA